MRASLSPRWLVPHQIKRAPRNPHVPQGNVCPGLAALFGQRPAALSVDSDPLLEISPVQERPPKAEPHALSAGTTDAAAAGSSQLGAAAYVPSELYRNFVRDVMPDLHGKVAIVTGANAGLGLWAARALAAKGATVVLACRDLSKANAAKVSLERELRGEGVQARLEVSHVDLASFASVRAFAAGFRARHARLDLLLNNAGIMAADRSLTVDGWDVQLQTNHLSHFLLTRELLDMLLCAPDGGRVVSHSSLAHKAGTPRINTAALNEGAMDGLCGFAAALPGAAPYVRYGQSKLANVLFAFELHRRLAAAGLDKRVKSVCAHPGIAATSLFDAPMRAGTMPAFLSCLAPRMQAAEDGALPLLLAATHANVESGAFYGPEKEDRGFPVRCKAGGHANDPEMARELWVLSELACGCQFVPADAQAGPLRAGEPAAATKAAAPAQGE